MKKHGHFPGDPKRKGVWFAKDLKRRRAANKVAKLSRQVNQRLARKGR